MKVAVATDTNSGILTEKDLGPGFYLLHMPVIIDGQMYLEGIDISSQQLYDAMRAHRDLSSSQPSPGQLVELWERAFADGYDEVVYIPMSSGLSSSCHNAIHFSGEYNGRVQVVDNHRISVTQEESVFSALHLARQGADAKEIKAHLEARAYDASIYITPNSLEYLKRGGRITPAVAAFAAVLNVKPVLTIQGDRLDAHAKVRGMRQAESKMIEAVKQDRAARFSGIPDHRLRVDTAGTFECEEDAQEWNRKVQEEFPTMEVRSTTLPCSIACHVGMNAAGIAITETSFAAGSV